MKRRGSVFLLKNVPLFMPGLNRVVLCLDVDNVMCEFTDAATARAEMWSDDDDDSDDDG